jgi:hypothetical protein
MKFRSMIPFDTMTGGGGVIENKRYLGRVEDEKGAQLGGAHNMGVEFSHVGQRMRDRG